MSSVACVCVNMVTRKPWRRKFIFGCPYILRGYRSSSYMKVIRSRLRSQEQKSMKFAIAAMLKNFDGQLVRFCRRQNREVCLQHGFLAMADRIVWPSLLHDRKWPRLTKCMHLQVVCLRLEGNLVLYLVSAVKTRSSDLVGEHMASAKFSSCSLLCCLIRMDYGLKFSFGMWIYNVSHSLALVGPPACTISASSGATAPRSPLDSPLVKTLIKLLVSGIVDGNNKSRTSTRRVG